MTDSSPFIYAHYSALLALLAVLLASCSSTPTSTIVDEHADYGSYPENYQTIAKDYLQSQQRTLPLNISTTKFLNTPDKYTYSHLGRQDRYGYRVCSLVSTADGRKKVSHFLLINNGKVVAHLHDTGFIKLSDRFCDVEMLLLDAHQQTHVAAELTPGAVAAAPAVASGKKDIKYLVCRANEEEIFFVFDAENNQLLDQRDGRVVTTFVVDKISDTFIIATANEDASRISINRVSGSMRYQHAGAESEGSCELDSRQKF